MKFKLLIKTKISTNEEVSLSPSNVVFIMPINVKMPTFVGILTFMSRINSCSAELSMEKFYNLRARFVFGEPNNCCFSNLNDCCFSDCYLIELN